MNISMSIVLVIFVIVLHGCDKHEKKYHVVEVNNPLFIKNTAFNYSEDISSPKFQNLKDKYHLDTIVNGETNEFKRILLLRHWIKKTIKIDDDSDHYPGDGAVEGILDAALDGTGFHCNHFMKVQNAVLNSFGYVTRTLGAGPGVSGGPDGHHGANEIWLNSYNKWFLSDAKYDHHFEKNGVPLSALEIRDEYLKNKAVDIVRVKGPDRVVIDIDPETGKSKERSAQTYTWIGYHTNNNISTVSPNHQPLLTVYEDDFFKSNTWIWDGKPHWAYKKPKFMIREQKKEAIYWTPNIIRSSVSIDGDAAWVELSSNTPNLKGYQMKKIPSGKWQEVENKIKVELIEDTYEFVFRTTNLADVHGPEHHVIIQSEKSLR